ncbi:MAG: peptidylprolyl isomerase [Planctomycetes bacterium]|nr:peptidylprolyl isomerase [Planctomycetota bacterium]
MPTRLASIRAALASTARRLVSFQGRAASSLGDERAPTLDALEPRQLMTVTILNPINDAVIPQNNAASVIQLAGRYDNTAINGTIAKFTTDLGNFNVELFNNATPQTVANFLRYITEGRYANTIVHRSVADVVIQAGGFQRPSADNVKPPAIATFAAVQNEPGILNARGTISLAKVGGNPNSGTSQFFFNLADNTSLDSTANNGGYTAFGRVLGSGMTVVDAIAGVPVLNAGTFYSDNTFRELPLRNFTAAPVHPSNFVGMSITTGTELTYSVTSTNSAVVSPVLDDNTLTLNYGQDAVGSSTITLRVTSADGSFIEDSFLVTLVGPPTIGAIVATPQPAVSKGEQLTLTAQNIADPTNSLAKIQFYRDSNSDGVFQADTDTLLGEDASAGGGWSVRVSTADFPLGDNRFFARAVDTNNNAGTAVSTVARVTTLPNIGSLTSTPTPIPRGTSFTLTASDFTLPGAAFKSVEFFRDTDGNGVFDARIDKKLGTASKLVNGVATAKASSKGYSLGNNIFFARLTDRNNAMSPIASATVAVTNALPTSGSLKITPAVVKNAGDPITLNTSGFKDSDGRIVKVEYFRDTEVGGDVLPNGIFDSEDVKIGESTSSGFKFTFLTTNLAGVQRFFARVVDNDGGVGNVVTATTRVNLAPTLGTFTVTPNTGPATTTFTASIASALDADGTIKSVELFRDVNNDGIYNSRVDKSLGKAKLAAGVWTLAISGKKLVAGENHLLARATDSTGGFSALSSSTITIG